MALQGEELFHRTMETMGVQDTLMIRGGTMPVVGETAGIQLDLKLIYPVMLHVTGKIDKYPYRPNPLVSSDEPLEFELTRNDKRFAGDHGEGPDIRYAKAGAEILGRTIDLWQIGFGDFFFVGRSSND